MSIRFSSIIALVLVATLLCLPTSTNAQQPTDSTIRITQVDTTHYPEITLYISVLDSNGQPLTRLTQGDFRITEDGTPVDVLAFRGGGEHRITTALVIDRSGSMQDNHKMDGAKEAAHTFVAQMQPGDQTTLIAFSEDATQLQSLTEDTAALNQAIQRLYPNGGTAIYDSVIAAIDALDQTSGRTVIVLLTDGRDCRESNICPPEAGSNHSLKEAIVYANKHEQPIYVVGLGERGRDADDDSGIDETVLQRLADETGGRYFYAPDASELVALYNSLAGTIHQEYALTYQSPRPFYDGTRRDIHVHIGATSSASDYTEQHLINVQSNLLVGVMLLLPLLVLLTMPTLIQRIRHKPMGTSPGAAQHVVVEDEPADATPMASGIPMPYTTGTGEAPQTQPMVCASCGKPLRPNAKFCGSCGARQTDHT